MISLPSSIKIIAQEDNQATFEIEGLYPGYGVTLGNALRRVLLSSLEGAAVTTVQIEGVPHEFSAIPGVKEDVIQIILNFKKLRFKLRGNEEQEGRFEIKGEKKLKGKDLILPSQVEIINPDQLLATLTSKTAKLIGRFKISTGIGYQSVEQRGEGKALVGEIPIDSIFTPVERVAFRVEQMRVEKRTDFNRLLLTIATDGTMSPAEALLQAIGILQAHLEILEDNLKAEKPKKEKEVKEEKGKKEKKSSEVTKLKIEDLDLPTRVKTALLDNHLKTVGGLLMKNKEKLLALQGISEKSLEAIEKSLKKLKLSLKEN